MYIRRPLCVFCLLFVLMLAAIEAVTGSEGRNDRSLDGQELRFLGTIKQIEHKDHDQILHIKNIHFTDGTDLAGNVLMYIPDQDKIIKQIHIGATIAAFGEFTAFRKAWNRGQFDLLGYHALRGDEYAVYKGSVLGVSKEYNHLTDGLYRIREGTERVYERYFEETDRGVIDALVLADKGKLDEDLRERYSDAGIAHILALSGLHIATVGFLLMNLLRRIRIPLWLSALISALVMASYCIMTGMPLSAVRALIMYFIAAGALLLKRTVDLRTSAALACLVMLVINPDRLSDASFLLSFSSVLGIGILYPAIRELILNVAGKGRVQSLKRSGKRLVRFGMGILSSLTLSVSVQLAIIPFIMWFYYRLSPYGILVNLIVVPLAGILLMLAICTGLIGSIVMYILGYDNPVDLLVRFLSYCAHLILKLYDLLTQGVNRLPGAVIVTGRPAMWQMIVYYLFMAGALAAAAHLTRKSRIVTPGYLRRRSLAALGICILSFPVLFVRIRPAFEISSLYVGQGQCFVIHGRDVPTIMYDCGSTDEKKLSEYTVEPFLECLKLDRIDTVFISHLDTDHISGLLQLLSDDNSHIKIGRIVISGDPLQKTSDNYESLISLARERGIQVCAMNKGDSLTWRKISARCLWPHQASGGDINDGSLVLSLEYRPGKADDFMALFTGDISSEVEDLLIGDIRTEVAGTDGYDYLQVAHHGSSGSANRNFTEAVSPKTAVISAGIDNRYGHPHKETLEVLNSLKIPVFITSECGETDVRRRRGE